MNCINCGKPTVGNAVFCRECAERQRTKRSGLRRSTLILSIALGLVAALAIGLIVYLFTTADDRAVEKAQLRVQQEELDRREYQLSLSEGETQLLTDEIAQLELDNDALRRQINELDSQLGAADSERNQSTSNYIQQVAELEQQLRQLESTQAALEEDLAMLQTQNEALTEERETLTEELETLTEDYDALQEELDDLQDRYDLLVENYRNQDGDDTDLSGYLTYKRKADFLDTYIVFVQDDGTGYYHTYDCSAFTSKDFWAYNRALAKSQGYTACPRCG